MAEQKREQPDMRNMGIKVPGMRGQRNRNEVEKAKNVRGTFVRLVGFFKDELKSVIALFVIVLISVVCNVYAPKLQSNAIDTIASGEYHRLSGILAMMLAMYGIMSLMSLFQGRGSALLSQSVVRRMREELFRKIVNLPVGYLDSHSHGDVMSRMTNDVENISNTISQSMNSLFSGIFTILGTVFMMLTLSPKLALLSMSTVIFTILTTKALSQLMRKFYVKKQVLLGNINGTVEEMVGGYRTVVAYGRQDKVIEDFDRTSDELTRAGIIAEILAGSMGPLMNVINNVGFVIIAAFGGYFAIKGQISIGVISAFIVYAKQFGRPIDELAQVYGQIQTAIAGAERVFAILDERDEDRSGNENMERARGVISFRNVDFSYVPGEKVIQDFNLEVSAGQKIALVGATGSGKTTIVNLLMRFYNADGGEILIDGVNIRDIDCDELRRNTAIVLQETVLFSDTVRGNIKYSNKAATDEEMRSAAKLSNCHDMIIHLKEGYDTFLSGGGANLSQGQRQLLTIARAFLAKPKILILDEATSSVDTRTEKRIQDAMVKLMENRTSLIIAHRLSTIKDADVIVVMDKGRIVEKGNHGELLKRQGRYYELYMTQFAGQST